MLQGLDVDGKEEKGKDVWVCSCARKVKIIFCVNKSFIRWEVGLVERQTWVLYFAEQRAYNK